MDLPKDVPNNAPSLDSIWKTNNLTENILEDIEHGLDIIVNSDGYKNTEGDCDKKAPPEIGTLIVLQSQADNFNNSAVRIRNIISKIRGVERPVGS